MNILEDAQRSGLSATAVKKLKFKALNPDETNKLTGKKCHSYRIPYFDISGKETAFYRVRFLDLAPKFGGDKVRRYTQPPNTLPHLYLPPLLDWKAIAKNPEMPLIITEGEKKAAKACSMNLPCIGLGGVWAWTSRKKEKPMLDDFDAFDWSERPVILMFDSDLADNPNVRRALGALAVALTNLGAVVEFGFLPQADSGDKQGLDDFLLNHTTQELFELEREPYARSAEMWKIDSEMAFIENPAGYMHLPTGQLFSSPKRFADTIYANRFFMDYSNEEKPKRVNAFNAWTEWPARRSHPRPVFMPGAPEVLDDGAYNLWKGLAVEPVQGDIRPFVDLVDFVFKDAAQEHRRWFWQWLAYPLQHPGVKMNTAVLVHGRSQGTGKSFIGYIMGQIYGEYFQKVTQDNLHGSYNDWAEFKQFILGEEITGSDRRRDADRLKDIITRESFVVAKKYMPAYSLQDFAHYYLTSQHADALYVEDKDRRFFIHELVGDPMSQAKYKEVEHWRHNGGPAFLLWHLLHKVDCTDFEPKAPAPLTEAKMAMTVMSRSEMDEWAHMLKLDPLHVLMDNGVPAKRDLYTAEELMVFFDRDGTKKNNTVAMAKALKRAGFFQANIGSPVRTNSGLKRLWIARNESQWIKASHQALTAHYDGTDIAKEQGVRKKVVDMKQVGGKK